MILFDTSDSVNRVAAVRRAVYQNIYVRQGLGREPQQAQNHSFPPQRKWVVFAFCVYKCIACTVTER